MNTNRQTVNHYNVDADFYQLVSNELVPGSVNVDTFWNSLTTILDQHASSFEAPENAAGNSSVSLLHPRYALKALNARWGSLYSALYHENAIPHTAGLKTGSKFNVARGSRVTTFAKEFLDSAFPLTEGSHKDAVSYLIYFQNLMVILADGSTVGLKNSAHFAAKSGPKSDPDSIILNNHDLHVEIAFDRRGATGSQDIANIEDVRVEAPANTLISFRANNIADKNEIYKNFKALVKGDLKANFDRDGKHHLRCLKQGDSYTAKDGDSYNMQGCNPMVLQLDSADTLMTICDQHNQPMPSALVDSVIAALITLHSSSNYSLSVSLMDSASAQTQTVLDQLSAIPGMPELRLNLVTESTGQTQSTKETRQSADMMPGQISCIGVAEEELKNTVTMATQNGAVLQAIHHFSV